MNILFATLHSGYYRNLESVAEELASRGHEVYLGCERPSASAFGGEPIVARLASTYPNVRYGGIPSREDDSLFLASKIRLGFDYLRYLEPIYEGSSGLVPRARVRTPAGIVRLSRTPLLAYGPARRLIAQALDSIDRAMPPSPAIEHFLDDMRPDLVVVTPLIGLVASSQVDLLRSAIRRGVPTAVFVWSWDHLSSKAIIRDLPDGLFVWNETQRHEAIDMHQVPAERIVITGAQCFDHWFDRTPSRSRADFTRHAGLPDDRPYVLWACSALLPGSPPEPDVVARWVSHLRASADPRVRDAGIVIRPHPGRLGEWEAIDWRRFGNIALFGSAPIDEQSRADYFDSLYYSAAVVGITTSAFIEAAIVGRPVMAFFAEDLRQEHEGSLHFQHLLRVEGGVMTTAASLEEHERQVASMLDGPTAEMTERLHRFVRAFVRPHGMEMRATGIAVEALERLTVDRPVPSAVKASVIGRIGLRIVRALAQHSRLRLLLLNEGEVETARRQDEKARLTEAALERKRQQRAEKARRVAERRRALARK
jgi:hypothetical protein